MTASDHLKQATGSLGGDQIPEDLQAWAEPLLNFNAATYDPLIVLERIAKAEAALAQKTRECEELTTRLARFKQPIVYHLRDYPEICPSCGDRYRLISSGPDGFVCYACWLLEELEKSEAQVEQLGRQVAEMSKPVTDEERKCFDALYYGGEDDESGLDRAIIAALDLLASRARTK